MVHLRTSDAGISGQRFAAEPGRARRRGAGIDVWRGTIHRKAGTHDRHENIWSIGTVERIAAQIRLYPRLDCYGSQRAGSPREVNNAVAITRDQYDAVLFDLDGVITDTANMHAACWKQMFDEYLQKRAAERGEPFRPFELATDYRVYVDGKPRFDGVRDFLKSRGIQLPEGSPDDPPQAETVGGLGNRKNELVNEVIEDIGVEPYEGSVKLIHQLHRQGFKI